MRYEKWGNISGQSDEHQKHGKKCNDQSNNSNDERQLNIVAVTVRIGLSRWPTAIITLLLQDYQ